MNWDALKAAATAAKDRKIVDLFEDPDRAEGF